MIGNARAGAEFRQALLGDAMGAAIVRLGEPGE